MVLHRWIYALAAPAVLLLAALAHGFALLPPIQVGPNNVFQGSLGIVVPLTPDAILVGTDGPDQSGATADDQILLIQNLAGPAQITPLATPYLTDDTGHVARLSATRAVIHTYGPDGSSSTADDTLLLLDRLGTDNTVTPITIGYLADWDWGSAVPLSESAVVLAGYGPDATYPSADDVIILVSDLGGTNTVTNLPAPFLNDIPRPAVLSPTAFLTNSAGPDANYPTADDLIYSFTDVGGTNVRADLPTPFVGMYASGVPVALTGTSAIVPHLGPDAAEFTADDGVYVMTDLGGANTVTPVAVPNLHEYRGSRPLRLAADRVALSGVGPDATDGTADDTVVLITDVGSLNAPSPIPVPFLLQGVSARPWPITPSRVAMVSMGPDGNKTSGDEQVHVLDDLGGLNTLTTIPISGLGDDRAHDVVAVNETSFLISSGGPDGNLDGNDDLINLVSGLPNAPVVQSIPVGNFGDTHYPSNSPDLLGGWGRAAYVTAGPDGSQQGGGDDEIHVLTDLSLARSLTVTKLTIKATPKGEKATVKATLTMGDWHQGFGENDVFVSIGPAAEALPRGLFTDNGKKVTYKAPKGSGGLIQSVVYKPAKGQLTIKAKGLATGLEATDPAAIPVALDFKAQDDGTYLSDVVAGTQSGTKIKFKAPK